MPEVEIRFTKTCADEIRRWPALRDEIHEMLREAIARPMDYPIDLLGRRKLERSNPGVVLYFWINDGGSITFHAFRGPDNESR